MDPTGEFAIAIPLIPIAIEGIKDAALVTGAILSGIVLGKVATDIVKDGQQDKSGNQKTENAKQQLESNAQSVTPNPMPPSPDDDEDDRNKSDRNKPKQTGPENGIEIEHNVDGSVKRVTQFDENGNFLKEVRPNFKGQHGIDGPTTKVPQYNTDASGKVHMNGYKVRPATPEEIMLLK